MPDQEVLTLMSIGVSILPYQGLGEASDIPRHRVSLRRCRGENPCRPRSMVVGEGEIGRQANEVSAVRGADARSVRPPSYLQSERGRPPRHRLPITFVRDFGVRFFCARIRGSFRGTVAPRSHASALSLFLSLSLSLSLGSYHHFRPSPQAEERNIINRDAHTGPYSLALRRASGQLQSDTQPSVSSPPHSKPCRRACGGERLRGATITRDTPRLRDLDRRRADARRRRSRDAPTRTRNSSPTEPRECRQQWHAFRRRDRENRVCRRA